MAKKLLCAALAVVILFSGCTQKTVGSASICFITDGTPIEDGWKNQSIWNTLLSMEAGLGVEVMNAVPEDMSTETLLSIIKKQADKGAGLFVLSGYEFAEALQQAQILLPNCKFIALDFAPQTLGQSVVSISFNTLEAGFMAGFAAALKLEEARVGAIFGQEIPSNQQYSWGFQQGVLYANANFGTRITMSEGDFKYTGTSRDDSLGQQLAAQFFDRGVECLFVAAGMTGDGAIIEAKLRRANGEDIWVVGSEFNQFSRGIYDGNNSVVITTAIKSWNDAIIDMVDLLLKDKFPGQTVVNYNAANGGVGLPSGDANLSAVQRQECARVAAKLANGEITPSRDWYEGLIK